MAASFDPRDDRQHGHAIRRRQGGRTSIYHDQHYPSSFWPFYLGEQEAEDTDEGLLAPPRGADGSTGAV